MQAAQHLGDMPSPLRLFDKAAFASARFPHLQAVFERMVAASLDSLREVCAVPPHYTFKDVQTETFGDTLDAIGEDDGLAAIFSVPEWDGRLLFAVDRAFVYAVTELILGGDGSEAAHEGKGRFTLIEKNVVRSVLTTAARALQESLAKTSPDLTITFEKMETDMSLVTIDDRNSQAVVAKFDLHALGRTGALRIVIPRATVRSARSRRGGAGEGTDAPESPWSRQMQDKIKDTDVRLRAVLEERQMTLKEIAGLKVGALIPLETRVDSRIRLECNDEPLFLCEVGQSDGVYTLRVDQVLERPGEIGS